jgi:hypothetical protein
MRIVVFVTLLATVACATTEPIAAASPPPAPTRLAPVAFNAGGFAAVALSPAVC